MIKCVNPNTDDTETISPLHEWTNRFRELFK